MIHTIIFDIGRVLVEFDWSRFVRTYYPDETMASRLTEAFWSKGYWKELDRGVLPIDEILQGFIDTVPDIEEQIRDLFDKLGNCVEQFPYAKEWITRLRHHGYQILFLSNYSDYLIERNPSALDFIPLMDGGIFSCRVKNIKPDPIIYEKLCELYHLTPSECIFIDDTEENILAARKLGIHGIIFSSYEQAAREVDELCEAQQKS